jgi:predicted ATPase
MLKSIEVRNFKSFRRARLKLAPLTLLIGANASGKSNAIEALELLAWMASGNRLGNILFAMQQGQLPLRGTLDNLLHLHSQSRRIEFRVEETNGSSLTLDLAIRVDLIGLIGVRIVSEQLRLEGVPTPLYDVEVPAPTHGSELKVKYNSFTRGRHKPITCIDQQPVFTQLLSPARFGDKHLRSQEIIPEAASRIQHALESILFLDPIPRHMRNYSFVTGQRLQRDGANISAVLQDLCQVQQRKDEVLTFIRALPEQDIVDVKFLSTPRKEVMVQLSETFGGHRQAFEAAVLSDGTLRTLAVAAALLSVPEGSMVVIEEIDNGVHPSRAALLLDNIQRVANDRRLRVLLTTHNPALLDALPLQALPHVTVAYRDPQEGDSRLVRLEDLPTYPELIARGPLGTLVTRGVLDRYLKSVPSEEERRAKALAWIDALSSDENMEAPEGDRG